MAGFATIDAAINAAGTNGKMQRLVFSKLMAQAGVAVVPQTLWYASGTPAVGTTATTGVANGRTLDKTSAGAFTWLNDAASGELANLSSFAGCSANASSTGTLILCDRLCDVNVGTAVGGTVTGADATARLAATTAPGDGGQLWTEVVATFSGNTNTYTFTITDNLGTATQTTPSIAVTAAAAAGSSFNSKLWQSLPTGGSPPATGARALTAITVTGVVATNTYNVAIVRPLATIPIVAAAQWVERDFMCEIPAMPKIWDNACLFLIYVPAAASTVTFFGELRVVAG